MQKLELLRQKIDEIDAAIIKKLAQRQKMVQQIGSYKALHHLPVKDQSREENLLKHYEKLCEQYDVPLPFVTRLFKIIMMHSRKLQHK